MRAGLSAEVVARVLGRRRRAVLTPSIREMRATARSGGPLVVRWSHCGRYDKSPSDSRVFRGNWCWPQMTLGGGVARSDDPAGRLAQVVVAAQHHRAVTLVAGAQRRGTAHRRGQQQGQGRAQAGTAK